MKVMVIGSGGREHAVVEKLKTSPLVSEIWVCPGNGGMTNVTFVNLNATDIDGITDYCTKNPPDFVVVTPDDPLSLGLVDRFNKIGIECFGPTKAAAEIESSKVFAKNLMKKYNIPTADYRVFDDENKAVIKADGLALGKGVTVANTLTEAIDAVKEAIALKKFGESGKNIVIEEYLEGVEVSVLTFTDGDKIVPMISSMDHKRALDGDEGNNTGGMGTVAPNPYYCEEINSRCMQEIFLPTIKALKAMGREFRGCLYFGLMLTTEGAKVIEYNCRFGDPEAQVVLPLLKSDLMKIMLDTSRGCLNPDSVVFEKEKAACCVIAASKGYPLLYQKGFGLTLPHTDNKETFCFCAGVKKEGEKLITNGGRVLGVTAVASNLKEAIENAYKLMDEVKFDNIYYRKDIGKKAMLALNKD